jgi:HPt (histidine-containing phosphotransfer) domain-containing protein
MITIDTLKEYGANVEEGIARCVNNEDFYIKMVNMALSDQKIYDLEKALAANDLDKAFEAAHGMKGMFSNLSLTPLVKPVNEITELLRSRTEMDYGPLLAEIKEKFEALKSL